VTDKKRKRGRPMGETIGGIIVGFDQLILRTTPPAQELVAKARPVRGVSGQDGSDLEVVFPDDAIDPAPADAGSAPSGPDAKP
jgi:hypothetical protein